MEKPIKHLHSNKLKNLQESIGFLDNYTGDDSELHIVKLDGSDEIDIAKTQALAMLAQTNKARNLLIEHLLK
jgi:hypothetical protein